jgi:hypothetical protein
LGSENDSRKFSAVNGIFMVGSWKVMSLPCTASTSSALTFCSASRASVTVFCRPA